MRVYNSLTRKKEELVARDGKKLTLYSCGVTVYDKCHLGHARSLYHFDVLTRYLRSRGFDVMFVRNITDVDDKIINKARAVHKTFETVVDENIAFYQRDLKSLGIKEADQEPRATENIKEIIAAVGTLIAKGYAYAVEGNVYYSVRAFHDYGKLSGQSVEMMLEAVRIDKDEKKRDALDFALWKKAKEGEPAWDSPWGPGRPGWHIECTCMSMKYLGAETIDIHAGGRDLIFPHHENEIAQSEALTGKPFARYWIHNGLLKIEGQKMSKSLGNFITVEDIVARYDIDDIKRFFLSAHYASEIDFSDEKIQEMHQAMLRIRAFIVRVHGENAPCSDESSRRSFDLENFKNRFFKAMDDDLNTPMALAVLSELINEAHKEAGSPTSQEAARFIEEMFKNIFGISLDDDKSLSAEQLFLLDERKKAREKKDFRRSDDLREQLKQLGIIVEDGKDSQTWRKA